MSSLLPPKGAFCFLSVKDKESTFGKERFYSKVCSLNPLP